MAEPTIRPASADDVEALAEVYRSAYRENRRLGFPAKAGSATAETVLEWIRESHVSVAEIDGRIVAGVRLEPTDSDVVTLSRLGVHEEWKGHGIGSTLLEHAETLTREWDRTTIRLTTPEAHPTLPDFYRKRGYEKTGPYPLDFREYDEIVMEKRLR